MGTLSKEDIKDRMMERMRAIWDVRDMDIVDPVIKLLIEALAAEVFRLTGELGSVETRILEKVADAMTPNAQLAATPSTAILHARALEGEVYVTPDTTFSYRDERLAKKYDINRVTFRPISTVKSIDGDVRYLIDGEGAYEMLPGMVKDLIGRPHPRVTAGGNPIYIGLEVGGGVRSLKDVAFYFDMRGYGEGDRYLPALAYAKWFAGGRELSTAPGLAASPGTGAPTSGIYGELNADRLNRLRTRFISVNDGRELDATCLERFPGGLAASYPDEFVRSFGKPLLWLRVDLPGRFTPEATRRLSVCVNAHPVANIFRKRVGVGIDEFCSFVPLMKQRSDYLLGIERVSDGDGGEYVESGTGKRRAGTAGSYSLRRGGCERFNREDAKGMVVRLVDALYDESNAFAGSDREELREQLQELLRLVRLLTQEVPPEERMEEAMSYLAIDTDLREGRRLTVDYWMTNAQLLNALPVSSPLECLEESLIDRDSIRLLTPIQGGRPSPDIPRKMDIYKYLLLSRDSIYTNEDIRNYCVAFYGEYIERVDVSLGYGTGDRPGQGIVRTLVVDVLPTGRMLEITAGKFRENLLADLMRRSPSTYNYRINIKNE
jgi:hypothetical protein